MIARRQINFVDYVEKCYAVSRPLKPNSVGALRRTATVFSEWFVAKRDESGQRMFGEVCFVNLVDREAVNLWLMEAAGRFAQTSLRRMRGDMMSLLREAARDGLCERPKRIREVKKVKPTPKAYRPDEAQKIIDACHMVPGELRTGVPRAQYFVTVGLVAWELGYSRCDLFRLRQADFRDDGLVAIARQKTGEPQYNRLFPETLALVRRLPGEQPLKWPGGVNGFDYWWPRIVEWAGVPYLGSLGAMRKSGATDVARLRPGSETRFLGHTTPATDVHYIDRTLLVEHVAQPTQLKATSDPQRRLF